MTRIVTVRVTDHITAQGRPVAWGATGGVAWATVDAGGRLVRGQIIMRSKA